MDVERFTTLARDGLKLLRADHADEAQSLLAEADRLYEEGDAWGGASWHVDDELELRSLRHQVLQALASAAVARRDHDAAIRYLLRLDDVDAEGSESLYALVKSAAAARRHGEARRYYRIYREASKQRNAAPQPFPGPGRSVGYELPR